jgi:phosphoribosylformimino-5-aminoimidazole carboxamide ribotide isomerase
MMQLYPAVDILDGQCVQLVQGKAETATRYGNPMSCAKRWLDEGADALHIINLDGAFGRSEKNAALIRELVRETGTFIQLGGGIRSLADAAGWLTIGVDRVILGTLATRNPESIKTLAAEYGSSRVMVSVDARGGRVAIEGWQELGGDYLEFARLSEQMGAGSLLYTNVDVEGLERGISPDPIRKLLEQIRLPVTVAGGITTRDDLVSLIAAGVIGAVLGSALYSGKIKFGDALRWVHETE